MSSASKTRYRNPARGFKKYQPTRANRAGRKKRRLLGTHRPVVRNVRKTVSNMLEMWSPERKFNEDVSPSNAAAPTYYFITAGAPLDYSTCFGAIANNVQEGTGDEERIGRKIRNTKIFWKFTVIGNDGALSQETLSYRVIMLVDKSASYASFDALMHAYISDPDVDPSVSTINMINLDYSSRFYILIDRTFTLDDVQRLMRTHSFNKTLRFPTEFFNTGANDFQSGVIWYGIIPSTSVATAFQVSSYMRLYYIDT